MNTKAVVDLMNLTRGSRVESVMYREGERKCVTHEHVEIQGLSKVFGLHAYLILSMNCFIMFFFF